MVTRILIMAGGTGGHVFPALAVAERLRAEGVEVLWLGTRRGIEADVVPRAGFAMATIRIAGLRGNGVLGWLLLPVRVIIAMLQSLAVFLRFRPMAVLGMGGFVTGPGGVTAWLLHRPLLIHEQNAIAGMTNRWLARLATRVLVAFPGVLPAQRPVLVGNPVRAAIEALPPPEERFAARTGPLRLLVLGGSQGARGLNAAVPQAVAAQPPAARPEVRHQAGRLWVAEVRDRYAALGVQATVEPFIERMADAYGWADFVICRAGALTIAELAAAGVGAILVPYPYAVDDHQSHNGQYLVDHGAALMLRDDEGLGAALERVVAELSARGRGRLLEMAQAARRLARPDAARAVSRLCVELAHA